MAAMPNRTEWAAQACNVRLSLPLAPIWKGEPAPPAGSMPCSLALSSAGIFSACVNQLDE